MQFRILAVGRVRESCFTDGIAEYCKRASRWARIEIVEVDDATVQEDVPAERALATEREADALLARIRGYCVVLDIDGAPLASTALAEKIGAACQTASCVTWVIGGSYGLSPRVKARADLRLSFGRVTFPHQLVRLMTAEQAYRVLTILHRHPYHK